MPACRFNNAAARLHCRRMDFLMLLLSALRRKQARMPGFAGHSRWVPLGDAPTPIDFAVELPRAFTLFRAAARDR